MTRAAIIEPAITQLVAEAREAVTALRDAEHLATDLEKKLNVSREAAQMRRLELGRLLLKARKQLPKRGTKEHGWGAYLEAIEVDEATAWRYMRMAASPSDAAIFQGEPLKDSSEQASLQDTPPPTDADAPREADDKATSVDIEIDRDTWCTPKWMTDALGQWDLDPCANERSHVQAKEYFELERRGEDGLVLASTVSKKSRVFLNPPYSSVRPWIDAYAHTRFCFLLKFDPSTKWFARLLELTEVVLLPRGTRVQFEAPDGVPPEMAIANPFPHALFYARDEDVSDAIRELCFLPWRIK